jgi:hypothetical protein
LSRCFAELAKLQEFQKESVPLLSRFAAAVGYDRFMPHPGDTILESEQNFVIIIDD